MLIPLTTPINTKYVGVQATHLKLLSWRIDEVSHYSSFDVWLYANPEWTGEPIEIRSIGKYIWQTEEAKNANKPDKPENLVTLEAIEERDEEQETEYQTLLEQYNNLVEQREVNQVALSPATLQAYGTLMQQLLVPSILSSFS